MALIGLDFIRFSVCSQSTGSWEFSAMTIIEIHMNDVSMLDDGCLRLCNRRTIQRHLRYKWEGEGENCIYTKYKHTKGVMRHGWMVMSHCRWANNALKINCCIKRFAHTQHWLTIGLESIANILLVFVDSCSEWFFSSVMPWNRFSNTNCCCFCW